MSTTPSTLSCSKTLLRTQNVPALPMGVLHRGEEEDVGRERERDERREEKK